MMRIILSILFLTPAVIYCFQGSIQCGDYTCIENDQVFCDVNVCRCRNGYQGNGRIRCAPNTTSICYMMGDPHITTFNGESAFIFIPCTQILTDLTKPAGTASEGPGFLLKVTAITDVIYRAKHASQIMIIGLFIETTTFANNEVDMRCDTNGCRNISAPYNEITQYENQGLNINVSRDLPNGQTVIQLHGIEIRFRAEDGSVSIEIPPNAAPDGSHPGLCNRPLDSSTYNAGIAEQLNLSYDEYLLFVNTGNVNIDLEIDDQCLIRYANVCSPREREASATGFCSGIFVDSNIRDCYYNFRNKNATMVMYDFNECHDNACNSNYVTYCNNLVTACGSDNLPSECSQPGKR